MCVCFGDKKENHTNVKRYELYLYNMQYIFPDLELKRKTSGSLGQLQYCIHTIKQVALAWSICIRFGVGLFFSQKKGGPGPFGWIRFGVGLRG
jgi:hypothetical protein